MTTPEDTSNQEQPLISHLIELRDRLLRSVLSILIIFVGIYHFSNNIYLIVSKPLRQLLPAGSTMIATDITSPFLAPFKLTMVVAVFAAMPYIIYQFWRFVAPALYQNEKKLAIPLLVSSILLFYLGVVFAYFVALPLAFAFFTSTGPSGIAIMPDINAYLSIVLKLFFAFGVAFEIPIATVIMVMVGVTTTASLKNKRPYIIIGCFVIGMLLTPPDIFSQTLLAVPMWMLFELGLFFGKFVEKNKINDAEQEPSED